MSDKPTPNNIIKGANKDGVADLIAQHGSASSTTWLESEAYQIWRPAQPIEASSFTPVQGYMQKDPWVFAWGNPLVSDRAALEPTARAFVAWAEERKLRPVWCCVDQEFEIVLGGKGSSFKWSTMSCISEDLQSAEEAELQVVEMGQSDWSEEDKKAVEEGIEEWKKTKGSGQPPAAGLEPWIDFDHRRYWVARKDGKIVGILMLTPLQGRSHFIKNCLAFPNSPRGTFEQLVYTVLKDVRTQDNDDDSSSDSNDDNGGISATFGISASSTLKPGDNMSGWRVTWLAKAYNGIAASTGLMDSIDSRHKFGTQRDPLYVCYPPKDGLGLDGINTLLKILK